MKMKVLLGLLFLIGKILTNPQTYLYKVLVHIKTDSDKNDDYSNTDNESQNNSESAKVFQDFTKQNRFSTSLYFGTQEKDSSHLLSRSDRFLFGDYKSNMSNKFLPSQGVTRIISEYPKELDSIVDFDVELEFESFHKQCLFGISTGMVTGNHDKSDEISIKNLVTCVTGKFLIDPVEGNKEFSQRHNIEIV